MPNEHVAVEQGKGALQLTVDTAGYPVGIIRRAAFSFVEPFFVFVNTADEGKLAITLAPKHDGDDVPGDETAEEFVNELKNQVLRDKLLKATRPVRELVIGRALFSASADLGDPFADEFDFMDEGGDFLEDPLGIAVSWEQKYGKEKEED